MGCGLSSWPMLAPLLLVAQRDALAAFALMRVCAGLRYGVPKVLVAVTVERRHANDRIVRLIARQLPWLQVQPFSAQPPSKMW